MNSFAINSIQESTFLDLGSHSRILWGQTLVQKAIEDNSAIVRAWKIDGVDLLSDPRRLLVAPAVTVSEPLANVAHDNFLEDYQIAMLESALSTAANAESISGAYESPAMLSVPTLRNALLRMAARDSDLPQLWAQTSSGDNFDKIIGVLDPYDSASFVETKQLMTTWGPRQKNVTRSARTPRPLGAQRARSACSGLAFTAIPGLLLP